MLVRPGLEPTASRSADRRSPNRANRAAVEVRFISRFPAFIPVTGLKCSYGKIFSQFTGISAGKTETLGNRVSPLFHNYEHIEIFTKDLEALRVLGNRASLVNRVHATSRQGVKPPLR